MLSLRLKPRLKRSMELASPEEILALLSMYEESRQRHRMANNYRNPWNRLDNSIDVDPNDAQVDDEGDENWLDKPVFPHATSYNQDFDAKYPYGGEQNVPRVYEKRGRWGGFTNLRNPRFMVRSLQLF